MLWICNIWNLFMEFVEFFSVIHGHYPVSRCGTRRAVYLIKRIHSESFSHQVRYLDEPPWPHKTFNLIYLITFCSYDIYFQTWIMHQTKCMIKYMNHWRGKKIIWKINDQSIDQNKEKSIRKNEKVIQFPTMLMKWKNWDFPWSQR